VIDAIAARPLWVDAVEKGLSVSTNSDSVFPTRRHRRRNMMGQQDRDQGNLFYELRLDDLVPKSHLLRRLNVFVTVVLADVHEHLKGYYSDIGRPSIDPELMIRMLIVGYCYGTRSERKLCEDLVMHFGFRWFCRLDGFADL
jgi:transposase